jgi:hypothetical protein
VLRGIAEGVFELTLVLWQERTGSVKVILIVLRVKGQGIQLATQRLLIAQNATFGAQILAIVFNAQVSKSLGLFLSERNFKRTIT